MSCVPRSCVAVALSAALLCLAAATASAGTYTHLACGGGSLSDASSGWFAVQLQVPAGTTGVGNSCAGGGGLSAAITPTDEAAVPPGVGVGWRYVPPTGTRIQSAGLTVQGWGTVFYNMATQFVLMADADVMFHLDGVGGSTGWPSQTVGTGPVNAGSLQALLRCAPTGSTCRTIYNLGWMDVRNLAVTLSDDAPPSATGPVTGSLVSGPVIEGNVTVSAPATDSGGGLRELQLFSDGARVARAGVSEGSCVPSAGSDGSWVFSAPRPCPTATTAAATFDSRLIRDGAHNLEVRLVDAGGNATTVYAGAKVVANAPPVNSAPPAFARADLAAAPMIAEPLRADAGVWSGPNLTFSYEWQRCDIDGDHCVPIADATAPSYSPIRADEGRRLRLAVTARNVVAVTKIGPLTGVVRSAALQAGASDSGRSSAINGVPQGGEPCANGKIQLMTPDLRGSVVRLRYRGSSRVRVLLACAADGRPVTDAVLRTRTHTPGDAEASVGSLKTDSTGRATVRFDGRASRTAEVTYMLRDGDDLSHASLTLQALVRGAVTLAVRQHGTTAVFHGIVRGGRVPERGVSLQLEWRDGQRWRPVASLKTDRRGRYSYTYRFSSRARGFRYAFRTVVTAGQTDYPFLPATSRIRRAGR